MNHGLFAIDVFARLHRIDGGLLVPMVGGGDDNGIDILASQDLAVVACGEDVVAPNLLAVRQPSVVTVGHGDKLYAGNLHGNFGVSLALNTSPDQRDLNLIVGGKRRDRLTADCGQCVDISSENSACGCGARDFQEVSAIQHV